jgi:TRAP-type C4-dicarboxylate transport system permease small subunit
MLSSMRQVVLNYLKSLGFVITAFAAAAVCARLATRKVPALCRGWIRVAAFLLGSGLLLVAAVGRLGWELQSWRGQSDAEILDLNIFVGLSLVGTFLVVFEYLAGRLDEKTGKD